MPPRTRTQPAADPLADLRPADDQTPPPGDPTEEQPDGGAAVPQPFTKDFHDDAVPAVVLAFHQDTVAVGALHKGGTCACNYLARLALRAALGEPVQAEPVQEEPEPDGGGGE